MTITVTIKNGDGDGERGKRHIVVVPIDTLAMPNRKERLDQIAVLGPGESRDFHVWDKRDLKITEIHSSDRTPTVIVDPPRPGGEM